MELPEEANLTNFEFSDGSFTQRTTDEFKLWYHQLKKVQINDDRQANLAVDSSSEKEKITISLTKYTSCLLPTIISFIESFNDTGENVIKLCAQTINDHKHFRQFKNAIKQILDKNLLSISEKLATVKLLCPRLKRLLVLLDIEGILFYR